MKHVSYTSHCTNPAITHQSMAVFLWHQTGVRRCLAWHMTAVIKQKRRNSTYFVVRGETGLAASMPWLKLGKIGGRPLCTYRVSSHVIQINQVPGHLWNTGIQPPYTWRSRRNAPNKWGFVCGQGFMFSGTFLSYS